MHNEPKKTKSVRVRTVQGSCWPCLRRRIKCDLVKPTCSRCSLIGAACSYDSRQIRWSTRPAPTAPTTYQVCTREEQLASSLPPYERRALEYFVGRLWPLMTTESTPCVPPTLVALESKAVLLAACVIADTHRVLQDGRNNQRLLASKRGQCLSTVRSELRQWCSSPKMADTATLPPLLMAVILLYLGDGFLDNPTQWASSTTSHQNGLKAIIGRLGSLDDVLTRTTYPEPLQMLITQFASGDLTTALIRGGRPSFEPSFWDKLNTGTVWWLRDPTGHISLAHVLGSMSRMAIHVDSVTRGLEETSTDTLRCFEMALMPIYVPCPFPHCLSADLSLREPSNDAGILAYSFQFAALIYLYRAIYRLPVSDPLVQTYVQLCLDRINAVKQTSKLLHCLIFPLFIAGTHALSADYRKNALKTANQIHRDMRFSSVRTVRDHMRAVWKRDMENATWSEMFDDLPANVVVL